jgi:hypothetical protein
VSRFRLRRPGESESKNIIMIADEREDYLGIFGLGMYNNLGAHGERIGIGNTTEITLVEGEMDAAQYMCHQFEQGNFDRIILAHGGATSRNITELKNYGVKRINYVGDWDKGGDVNTKELMIESPCFTYRLFVWPDCLAVPGPKATKVDLDLALRIHGWDAVNRELNDFEKRYIKPELWCKEQIKKIVRTQGIDGDDHAISKLVQSYAPCIGDVKDESKVHAVTKWLNGTMMEWGVSQEQAEKFANDFIARESEELVFIKLLETRLLNRFDFMAFTDSKQPDVITWDRQTSREAELPMISASRLATSFSTHFGTLIDWVKEQISIPDFIRYIKDKRGDPADRALPTQEEELSKYLHLAVKGICRNLRPLREFTTYASGYRLLEIASGKKAHFIVNGSHVFMAPFSETEPLEWQRLNSPHFERFRFTTTNQPWSKFVTSEAVLNTPPTIGLRGLLETVYDILDLGFAFESQATECMAHASIFAQSAILDIYQFKFQMLARAESTSGKSKLYSDLVGGKANSAIHLVEHSHRVDNTTLAGVRQSMDGSSLILILDEFDNTKHSKYVAEQHQGILTILRGGHGGEGINQQGTQGGKAKTINLSFPAMVAGIDPEIPEANMNRMFSTDLKTGLRNRQPPEALIQAKYSEAALKELKKNISLSMFQHVPALLRSHAQIEKYFLDHPKEFPTEVSQRFKQNLCIILALPNAAGLDWLALAHDICKAKSKALISISKMSQNNALVGTLMSTPFEIGDGTDRSKTTLLLFLSQLKCDASVTNTINNSNTGFYIFVEDIPQESRRFQPIRQDSDVGAKEYFLFIVWQETKRSLLRSAPEYFHTSISSLKDMADRHAWALNEQDKASLLTRIDELPDYVQSHENTVLCISERVWKEQARVERILAKQKVQDEVPGDEVTFQ